MATLPQWPRSFTLRAMQGPKRQPLVQFSPRLFRGPDNQPPQELYSDNYDDSEILARMFLDESVLGFDMEWTFPQKKNPPPPKEAASVIQVATESKIAIFHIGQHRGQRPSELLAPSLRKIIENRNILKTGQSIMGDFARLHRYFGLEPKGAMELSYLNILTDPHRRNFETYYRKGGLKQLVEDHFVGYTLLKDSKQHNDWLKPMTPVQQAYAAADVYAGVMLYYRMNAKRLEMRPCPPLPAYSEDCFYWEEFGKGLPPPRELKLQPLRPGARIQEAEWFFSMEEDPDVSEDLDPQSASLYKMLLRGRKEKIAEKEGLKPHQITTDSTLRVIATTRPRTADECAKLRGLAPKLHEKLAIYYTELVTKFERGLQEQRRERIEAEERQQKAREEQERIAARLPSPCTSVSEPDTSNDNIKQEEDPDSTDAIKQEDTSTTIIKQEEAPASTTTIKQEHAEPSATNDAVQPTTMHTSLTFYMADTALNEGEAGDGDETEEADAAEDTGTQIKEEPVSQEENRKRKRMSDHGGVKDEDVKVGASKSARKRSG